VRVPGSRGPLSSFVHSNEDGYPVRVCQFEHGPVHQETGNGAARPTGTLRPEFAAITFECPTPVCTVPLASHLSGNRKVAGRWHPYPGRFGVRNGTGTSRTPDTLATTPGVKFPVWGGKILAGENHEHVDTTQGPYPSSTSLFPDPRCLLR